VFDASLLGYPQALLQALRIRFSLNSHVAPERVSLRWSVVNVADIQVRFPPL
jgi:hypothetical protein